MDDLLDDNRDDSFSDLGSKYVYKVIRELGKGSFGRVCLCTRSDGKTTYECAVKIFSKSFLKNEKRIEKVNGRIVFSNALQQVEREFAIMKKLHHPNLVRLLDVIDDPDEDRLYMVIEYVEKGQIMYSDIPKHLYYSKETNGPLPEDKARRYFRDIIVALKYLHEHGVVHRDIKPENILLTKDDHCKIADFGVAHLFTNLCREDTTNSVDANNNNNNNHSNTIKIEDEDNKRSGYHTSLQNNQEEDDAPYFSNSKDSNNYNNDINKLSSYDDYHHNVFLYKSKSLNRSQHNNLIQGNSLNNPSLSSSYGIGNDSPLQEITKSLSEITKTDEGDLQNTAGTMYYMPPEVCEGNKYNTFAADIWAVGVTLYVMVVGTLPLWIDNPLDFYDELEKCSFQLPTNVSDDLYDLLSKLLEKDPNHRITIPEIIDHPWFKGVDDYSIKTTASPINIRNSISLKDIQNAFTSSKSFILTQNNSICSNNENDIIQAFNSLQTHSTNDNIEIIPEESSTSILSDTKKNKQNKCSIL